MSKFNVRRPENHEGRYESRYLAPRALLEHTKTEGEFYARAVRWESSLRHQRQDILKHCKRVGLEVSFIDEDPEQAGVLCAVVAWPTKTRRAA